MKILKYKPKGFNEWFYIEEADFYIGYDGDKLHERILDCLDEFGECREYTSGFSDRWEYELLDKPDKTLAATIKYRAEYRINELKSLDIEREICKNESIIEEMNQIINN